MSPSQHGQGCSPRTWASPWTPGWPSALPHPMTPARPVPHCCPRQALLARAGVGDFLEKFFHLVCKHLRNANPRRQERPSLQLPCPSCPAPTLTGSAVMGREPLRGAFPDLPCCPHFSVPSRNWHRPRRACPTSRNVTPGDVGRTCVWSVRPALAEHRRGLCTLFGDFHMAIIIIFSVMVTIQNKAEEGK